MFTYLEDDLSKRKTKNTLEGLKNLDFTFKVNYSGWNTVDDKDVTPSQTVIDSATGNVSSDASSNSSTVTTSDKPAD